MAGFTRDGAMRIVRATQLVEQRYGVGATSHYRRRFPRGGEGEATEWGQLIGEVPPDSILESEVLKRETFSGWFSFVYDPPDSTDPDDIVKIWVANPSLNTTIRGSEADPLRVFGEIFAVERTEGEATVTHQVFMILGHLDPLVGAKGFVKSPDNDRGQVLLHHDGQSETVADGGPCGDEAEPPP